MLKIGICDDERIDREMTCALIDQYLIAHEVEAQLTTYADGETLLARSAGALDILFLDIELGGGQNGLDIARKYQENYFHTIIVITSAHKNYITDAYNFDNIFQYLLKPLEKDFFDHEMTRILRYHYFQNDFYYLKNNDDILVPIKFKDIVYIQSHKNWCQICCRSSGEPLLFRASFHKQALTLKKYGFLRCHKRYIVNLRFVTTLSKDTLTLQVGGQSYTIPVSKKSYPEINDRILDFKARAMLCDFGF